MLGTISYIIRHLLPLDTSRILDFPAILCDWPSVGQGRGSTKEEGQPEGNAEPTRMYWLLSTNVHDQESNLNSFCCYIKPCPLALPPSLPHPRDKEVSSVPTCPPQSHLNPTSTRFFLPFFPQDLHHFSIDPDCSPDSPNSS